MIDIVTKRYYSPYGDIQELGYETLQPLLKPDIDILFIGINPHPLGVKKGAYFSNTGALWNQLKESGITDERISCKRLLRLNMGITNVVLRPSITSAEVSEEDLAEGRLRVIKEVEYCSPKIICCIGKLPYLAISQREDCEYGWQEDKLLDTNWFVMMFPTFRCDKKKKLATLKPLAERAMQFGVSLPKSFTQKLIL